MFLLQCAVNMNFTHCMLLDEICLMHLHLSSVLLVCPEKNVWNVLCVCVCVLCMLFWTARADSAALCGILRRRMCIGVESSHLLSLFLCSGVPKTLNFR